LNYDVWVIVNPCGLSHF